MQNPLAKFLSETGTSQVAFAKNGPWRQATVSGWCNAVIPSIADAIAIEAASGGAVAVQDWADYTAWRKSGELPRASAVDQCGEHVTNGNARENAA